MGLGKRANQVRVRHCLVSLLRLIEACLPVSHLCSAYSVEVEAKEGVPSISANQDSLQLQAVEGAAFAALAGIFEGHTITLLAHLQRIAGQASKMLIART